MLEYLLNRERRSFKDLDFEKISSLIEEKFILQLSL